jgi:enoyl-CoA hydratase/carnithine racemase
MKRLSWEWSGEKITSVEKKITLLLLVVQCCSGVYENQKSAESAALSLANDIASKSPVAVQGSKVNLNYSRDHPVDNALEYAVRE